MGWMEHTSFGTTTVLVWLDRRLVNRRRHEESQSKACFFSGRRRSTGMVVAVGSWQLDLRALMPRP